MEKEANTLGLVTPYIITVSISGTSTDYLHYLEQACIEKLAYTVLFSLQIDCLLLQEKFWDGTQMRLFILPYACIAQKLYKFA